MWSKFDQIDKSKKELGTTKTITLKFDRSKINSNDLNSMFYTP